MSQLYRITNWSTLSKDKACIRDTGVTVATVLTLLAEGKSVESILATHPALETDDIEAAVDLLKGVLFEGSSTRPAAILGISRRSFIWLLDRFRTPRPGKPVPK